MKFLDFNDDGKIDPGEQFIGYQIYKDVTGQEQEQSERHTPATPRRKVDGITIFVVILFAFQILSLIASLIYR